MVINVLRHALKSVRARPSASLTSVALLALGTASLATVASVFDALLYRPLPFESPAELANIYMGSERGGRLTVSAAVLDAWGRSNAFTGAESAVTREALVTSRNGEVNRELALVTPGIFQLLGNVKAVRGQLFYRGDPANGTPDRVVISEELWRDLFQADPLVVGRHVDVDGEALVVSGVVPSGFRFPTSRTDLWRSLDFRAPPQVLSGIRPSVYVRFTPGIPATDAQRLAAEAAHAADVSTAGLQLKSKPLPGAVADPDVARAAPFLLIGIALFVGIVSANLAGLQLAQLRERERDYRIRSALGASRTTLLLNSLVEAALIGAAGVLSGLGLAILMIQLAARTLPAALLTQSLNPVHMSGRVALIAATLGLLVMLLFGSLPPLLLRRQSTDSGLSGGLRATESAGPRKLARVLLVAQIALATCLTGTAAVATRSFANMVRVPRGIAVSNVFATDVSFATPAFATPDARSAARAAIRDATTALPGIESVTWSYGLPPDGGIISSGQWTSDALQAPVHATVDRYSVGPDFFRIYSIPILRGRGLNDSDPSTAVVIGERWASLLWPSNDPIGRGFAFGDESFSVVGVAGELQFPALDRRLSRPEFYQHAAGLGASGTLSIRCTARCPAEGTVTHAIRRAASVTVTRARYVEQDYATSLAVPKTSALVASALSLLSIGCAAMGLFALLKYSVSRRMREFGIRVALGVRPAHIRLSILREALMVSTIGVLLGCGLGMVSIRPLASLMYGVAPHDVYSWLIAGVVLSLTVVCAAVGPANTAAAADPVSLLRQG